MQLLIVSASQRALSQSRKVALYMSQFANQFEGIEHLDLQEFRLGFWDGDDSELDSSIDADWRVILQASQNADALILVTPEWGGVATPLLKSYLMRLNSGDVAHKPVLIVSVVSGISGAYPIAELRMNAFRNNKMLAIPDHIIVRHVEQVLNQSKAQSPRDERLRERIAFSTESLFYYAAAMQGMRKQLDAQPEHYRYGM